MVVYSDESEPSNTNFWFPEYSGIKVAYNETTKMPTHFYRRTPIRMPKDFYYRLCQSISAYKFIRYLPIAIRDLDCFKGCYHLRLYQWMELDFEFGDQHRIPEEVAIYDSLFRVWMTENISNSFKEDIPELALLDEVLEADIQNSLSLAHQNNYLPTEETKQETPDRTDDAILSFGDITPMGLLL